MSSQRNDMCTPGRGKGTDAGLGQPRIDREICRSVSSGEFDALLEPDCWLDRVEGSARRNGRSVDEVRQRDVLVRESSCVNRLLRLDECLHIVGDVPDVDVHPREDASVLCPEGDEFSGARVSAVDDVVVTIRADVAGVLHSQVVLICEEVGDSVVGDRLTKHRTGSQRSAIERVGPVLYSDAAPEEWVEYVGYITGCVHIRMGRLKGGVDEDTIVDVELGVFG